MIFLDLSLEKKYLEDFKIIKEEMEPMVVSLEEKNVDMFSLIIFLSTFIKGLLNESDDKKKKELITRLILD